MLLACAVAALMVVTPITPVLGDVLAGQWPLPGSSLLAKYKGGTRDVPTGKLSGDQVETLGLPDSTEADEPVSMPEGDFGALLADREVPPPSADLSAKRGVEPLAEEVADLPIVERDEYSVTFERPNGSKVKRISTEPVNFEANDGSWREISTKVVPSGDGWRVDDHPLSPSFRSNANARGAVTVSREGHDVSFSLLDIGAGRASVKSSDNAIQDRLVFDEVAPQAALEYEIEAGSVKETLVLAAPPKGAASWRWRLDAGGLEPHISEQGVVQLIGADQSVVMHIPTPVAWDSAGEAGALAESLINPRVTLERSRDGSWVYGITVDEQWLHAKDRVYPVSIDPTMQPGPDYVHSIKSDGSVFNGQLHIGNTQQPQDRYWRAFARFPYGAAPGRFIADAQVGIAYDGQGTTSWQGGNVSHVNCIGYNCIGTPVATFGLDSGTGWTSGEGVARELINAFANGNTGVTFMLRGNETPGQFTYKRVWTNLFIDYWDFPWVSQSSPANGATGLSLTPTLSVSGSGAGPDPRLNYWFSIKRYGDTAPAWESGWTSSQQVTVPEGRLLPDETYIWQVEVVDGYNGHLGQSTKRVTGEGWLRTEHVPPTPPVGSASPGSQVGQPETITTLTPTLQVDAVADADNVPAGGQVKYEFKIATGADGRSGNVFTSGLIPADPDGKVRWTVPEGTLQDGGVYSWIVQPHDGMSKNVWPTWVKKLKVDRRLGATGPSPFDKVGPATVNLANGNLNVSFSSPTVNTLGGPMGMSFTYNSQAVRASTQGLTGSYFSARDGNGNLPTDPGGYTFAGKTPIVVRTDPAVSFDWGTAAAADSLPDDFFMARWDGYVRLPHQSSRWRIGVRHDDGVRLAVNNELLVNSWNHGGHGIEWSGERNYGTGSIPIQLEYYEVNGPAYAEIWADDLDDNAGPVIIPGGWFSRTPAVLPEGWSASTPIAGSSTSWSSAAISDSAVVLTDLSGATHTYVRASQGGYTPPVGEYGVVSIDGQGRVVFTDEDGTVYQFTNTGRVESATPASDALKPATPILVRNGAGVVTEVVDPASKDGATYHRKVQFVYQNDAQSPANSNCESLPPSYWLAPAGMLCKIIYPDGSATNLHYGPNESLWMIEDPGAERTWFGYSDRILTQVRDSVASDYFMAQSEPPGYEPPQTSIEYASGRVSAVALPSPDGAAGRQRKTYAYDTVSRSTVATVDGVAGHNTAVTYDAGWKQLTTTSPMGVSSTNAWHPTKDLLLSSTASTGTKSTTIYDPATDRATDTYGPAPAACFGATGIPVGDPVGTSGCGILPGHTNTVYDGGMPGLHAAYYSNSRTLAGQPKAFNLGLSGAAGGVVDRDWGTTAPISGVSADNFSLRLTGLITFPTAGTYTLRTTSDDGARVWLNDALVIDRWVPQAPTDANSQSFTVSAGETKRIRIEYFEVDGGAMLQLKWATPENASFSVVPGTALRPDYGNVTSTTADDAAPIGVAGITDALVPDVTATMQYDHPWLGQATSSTVDPAGLNLKTSTTWESPGASGWLRRLTRTLPAGNKTGAPVTAKTQSVYYGDLELAPAACGVGGVRQFGMLKSTTGPTPATGAPVTTEHLYDALGRTVGTRVSGDTDWSCTTFDSRGRVTQQTYAGPAGVASRTVTTSYSVPQDMGAAEVSVSDGGVPGSLNNSTVTTTTDFLGRTVRYIDVSMTIAYPEYDVATGRVTRVKTVSVPEDNGIWAEFGYDLDGKPTSVTQGGELMATISHDAQQRLAGVAYAGGAQLAAVTRDGAERTVGLNWSFPGSAAITDAVLRAQSGRVIRDTLTRGAVSHQSTYGYDAAGRLVTAKIPSHSFTYGYAATGGCGANVAAGASGNRTSVKDVYTKPGNAAKTTTTKFCYDWADRLTSSTVTNPEVGAHAIADGLPASEVAYDVRGNVTKLGDMTFAYDAANRHVSTTYADGTVMTLKRDVTDRIVSRVVTPTSGSATTTQYRYSAGGDVPYSTVQGSQATRHLALPGGAQVTLTGAAREWSYPGILGHTLATGNGASTGELRLFDPFGQPLDPATRAIGTVAADDGGASAGRTGWHQSAMKLAHSTGTATVVEMGARLYVPALGRFLEVDPIEGGVDNDYVWPTDPVGGSDVSGEAEEWRGWLEGLAIVAGIAGAIACAASVVCGVVGAVAIGVAAGAAAYMARDGFSERFSANGLAGSAVIGGLGGGGVTAGIRAVASRTISRAIPMGSAAVKIDAKHRVGAWAFPRVKYSGAVRITKVWRTNSYGLSVTVRSSINGRSGYQNWIVGRGYLVHSFFRYR